MDETRPNKYQTREEMSTPTNPLQRLSETLAFTARDCGEDKMIAFMYGIIMGWDDEAYAELRVQHNWTDKDIDEFSMEAALRRAETLERAMENPNTDVGKTVAMRNLIERKIKGKDASKILNEITRVQEINQIKIELIDLEKTLERYRHIKGIDKNSKTKDFETEIQKRKNNIASLETAEIE